jgi:hypothetical protein
MSLYGLMIVITLMMMMVVVVVVMMMMMMMMMKILTRVIMVVMMMTTFRPHLRLKKDSGDVHGDGDGALLEQHDQRPIGDEHRREALHQACGKRRGEGGAMTQHTPPQSDGSGDRLEHATADVVHEVIWCRIHDLRTKSGQAPWLHPPEMQSKSPITCPQGVGTQPRRQPFLQR